MHILAHMHCIVQLRISTKTLSASLVSSRTPDPFESRQKEEEEQEEEEEQLPASSSESSSMSAIFLFSHIFSFIVSFIFRIASVIASRVK